MFASSEFLPDVPDSYQKPGYHRLRGHLAAEFMKTLLRREAQPRSLDLGHEAKVADMAAEALLERLGIPHPDS